MWMCGWRNECESHPGSYEHYLGSSENKAWKKIKACVGFEPMTSATVVQCSTNWANKPTGSWSSYWLQIVTLKVVNNI